MQEKGKSKSWIRLLPVFGCISTALIYLAIGVIAILSYLKVKKGGADESALVAFMNDFLLGKIFIWIILVGTVCYIAWRIYESITDPYDYGKDAKGMATRIGIGLSTIADILIAFTAVQGLFNVSRLDEHGSPEKQRKMVQGLLELNYGDVLVCTIGVIILITAVIQLIYGVSNGYKERIDMKGFNRISKRFIHFLGWYGYTARAIILGIIGFFFIKAGVTENPGTIVNTDKAFDFIGDNLGGIPFFIAAVGTICYGVFMGALGLAYEVSE